MKTIIEHIEDGFRVAVKVRSNGTLVIESGATDNKRELVVEYSGLNQLGWVQAIEAHLSEFVYSSESPTPKQMAQLAVGLFPKEGEVGFNFPY